MKQIMQWMLVAICTLATAVWAQQTPPPQQSESHEHMNHGQMAHEHHMMNADEHMQMLAEKLNLTEDQKAKIKPIVEEHLQQRQSVMEDQSLSPEQKREKMKASMEAAHSKMDAVLNDEQKKQLAEMMNDMHGQGKGMHGHKGGHHGDKEKEGGPSK